MGAVAMNCTLFFIQYSNGFINMTFFEPSAYSVIRISHYPLSFGAAHSMQL